MVIDDAARVKAADYCFGALSEFGVPQCPCVARVLDSIYHVRVHVLAVSCSVVTHGIEYDRRMVLSNPHVELRVACIAVCLIGVGFLPVIMGEMRLG